jgi:drug/metabolite transporter (DMT)-like permease
MSTRAGGVGFAVLAFGAALYGLMFPFNRMATEAGALAFGHAFWQTGGAGLLLLVLALLQGERLRPGRAHLLAFLIVGGLGTAVPFALFAFVAPHLPAGVVSIVLALSPTFTYLVGVAVRIERVSALALAGVALGLLGVALIVGPTEALPDPAMAGWFLVLLAVPVLFGIANVSADVLRPPTGSSTILAAGYLLGAAAIALPMALATRQLHSPLPPAILWPTLGTVAVNGIFTVLFCEIVRRWGATFFAQFNYLAVVASVVWAGLIFGERINLVLAIAIACMVAGILLTDRRPRRLVPAGG